MLRPAGPIRDCDLRALLHMCIAPEPKSERKSVVGFGGGVANTQGPFLESLLSDESAPLREGPGQDRVRVLSGPAIFLHGHTLAGAHRRSTAGGRAGKGEPSDSPTAGRVTPGTEMASL